MLFLCSLKTFVEARPVLDLMTAEEHSSIESSLKQAKSQAAAQPNGAEAQPDENGDMAMDIDEERPSENAAPGETSQPAAGGLQDVAASEITVEEAEVKAHWLSGVQALYEVHPLTSMGGTCLPSAILQLRYAIAKLYEVCRA